MSDTDRLAALLHDLTMVATDDEAQEWAARLIAAGVILLDEERLARAAHRAHIVDGCPWCIAFREDSE